MRTYIHTYMHAYIYIYIYISIQIHIFTRIYVHTTAVDRTVHASHGHPSRMQALRASGIAAGFAQVSMWAERLHVQNSQCESLSWRQQSKTCFAVVPLRFKALVEACPVWSVCNSSLEFCMGAKMVTVGFCEFYVQVPAGPSSAPLIQDHFIPNVSNSEPTFKPK